MERYFLVTYAYEKGFGNFSFMSFNYPSQAFINDYTSEVGKIVILNIIEFKSEKDFKNYQKQ